MVTDSTSRLIAQYGYDQQNQLTCETRYTYVGSSLSGSYTSFEYFYDTAGNLLCVKENGVVIESYAYGNSSWSDLLTSYNGHNIAYEGQTLSGNTVSGTAVSGNPVTWYNGSGINYTDLYWEQGRRLTAMQFADAQEQYQASFTYEMDGVRTQKNVDGELHKYVTQNGKVVREKVYSGSTLQYTLDFIYDAGGQPFALIRTLPDNTKTTYYYVLNAQGDVVKLINAYGTTYATYRYDAWGRVLSATGTLAEVNPLRYRGYYYDTETGWYYLQSRYYDPIVKRFLNADSYGSTGQGFLGCNMFAYCRNTPTILSDDCGNSPYGALTIVDYAFIHLTVQLMIRDETLWDVEVVVYDSEGNRGRLDVYDSYNNEFYEVKSVGIAYSPSTVKQMSRYEDSVYINNYPYQSNPSPGTIKVKGSFNYGNYTVNYGSSNSVDGLIVYSVRPSFKKVDPINAFAPNGITFPAKKQKITAVSPPVGRPGFAGSPVAGAVALGLAAAACNIFGGHRPWVMQPS